MALFFRASGSNRPFSAGLKAGYYLVLNTVVPDGYDTSYSDYIVKVVADVTMEPKSDVPTVEKSVSDNDVYVGQTVTYTLTATLPSDYAEYTEYKLVFHDTLSSGLTYNYDPVVTVYDSATATEGTVVTSGYTVSPETSQSTTNTDGCTLEVTISDTNTLEGANGAITVTKDSVIKVTYTATVDSDAVAGNDGSSTNLNTVYLVYSNNPNGTGTGKTTTSKVTVFTFELDLTKVDGSNTSTTLAGAEFYLTDENGKYLVAKDNGSGSYTVKEWSDDYTDATTLVSPSNGKISITGLATGTYYLYETKAPDGYNSLSGSVKIVIDAKYTDNDGDGVDDAVSSLTITVGTGSAEDGNVTTGVVSTDIKNNKGVEIPTTGGMGTTILYIIGAILVIGAAVLLITRRRMAKR